MTAMVYGSDGYPADTPESQKTRKVKEVNLPPFVVASSSERIVDSMADNYNVNSNYDSDLLHQLAYERNQAIIQRDVVENQLRITKEVLEKEKDITRKRFERRNICSATVDLWNVAIGVTILIASALAGALTWYYSNDKTLSFIVFGFGLIFILPSLVIFREYLRHNYRINGRIGD